MDKWIKIIFGFFALFAIIFGFVSIKQNIQLKNIENDSQNTQQSGGEFDEARLRVLDTDEDGLTDWDELNIYGTSPYLEDTDSDGTNDNIEIANNTDPNCPKGRVCGSDIIKTLEQIQQDVEDSFPEEDQNAGQEQAVAQDFSTESISALAAIEQGKTPTPSQIRSLLRDSGIPEEQINNTSDSDLIDLFLEVAQEVSEQ